jgi:hypothetical protein
MFDEKRAAEEVRIEEKTRRQEPLEPTIDCETFILHQLCSLLEHFRPKNREKSARKQKLMEQKIR